jgi:hypothetical protein
VKGPFATKLDNSKLAIWELWPSRPWLASRAPNHRFISLLSLHPPALQTSSTRIATMAVTLSHRYQSSLEDIIGFSVASPIFESSQQRAQAVGRFHRIVAHFESAEQQPASSQSGDGYNRPALVRLIFKICVIAGVTGQVSQGLLPISRLRNARRQRRHRPC